MCPKQRPHHGACGQRVGQRRAEKYARNGPRTRSSEACSSVSLDHQKTTVKKNKKRPILGASDVEVTTHHAQRGPGRGLDHDGVPEQQRRRPLLDGAEDREVPGCDAAHHADRPEVMHGVVITLNVETSSWWWVRGTVAGNGADGVGRVHTVTERRILIGAGNKTCLRTGVGLKHRGGRGGGRASLRRSSRVCERAGLHGAPKARAWRGH